MAEETSAEETSADNGGYTKTDCMNELRPHLRKRKGEGVQNVKFAEVDKATGMPEGSSKKYLVEAAKAEGLTTSEEGNININVDFGTNPRPQVPIVSVTPTRSRYKPRSSF